MALDRGGRDGFWEAGGQPRDPTDGVGLLAHLFHAADDDVVNRRGIDGGPFESLDDDVREELCGMDAGERAIPTADRRADGLHHERFSHVRIRPFEDHRAAASSEALPKDCEVWLAVRRQRHPVDTKHSNGVLEGREMLLECRLEDAVRWRAGGIDDDGRGRHLVHHLVGYRERDGLGDTLDVAEHGFDLAWRDLLTAPVDDLVLAAGEEDQIPLVAPRQVA